MWTVLYADLRKFCTLYFSLSLIWRLISSGEFSYIFMCKFNEHDRLPIRIQAWIIDYRATSILAGLNLRGKHKKLQDKCSLRAAAFFNLIFVIQVYYIASWITIQSLEWMLNFTLKLMGSGSLSTLPLQHPSVQTSVYSLTRTAE